jgi:hypothetical protein
MTTNNNKFRAPMKSLKTSWNEMVYSKPKKGKITVKRSLGNTRQIPLVRSMGMVLSSSSDTSY